MDNSKTETVSQALYVEILALLAGCEVFIRDCSDEHADGIHEQFELAQVAPEDTRYQACGDALWRAHISCVAAAGIVLGNFLGDRIEETISQSQSLCILTQLCLNKIEQMRGEDSSA